MTRETINRRRLLQGAGIAGATALSSTVLAGSANAKARKGDHHHGHDEIEGAWMVNHRDDPGGDPTEIRGVVTFAEGGVLTNLDLTPSTAIGIGAWHAHHDSFRGTFWSAFPGETPEAPTFTVEVTISGEVDDDEIEGTYAFTVFDGTGAEFFSGTGTFDGERLEA